MGFLYPKENKMETLKMYVEVNPTNQIEYQQFGDSRLIDACGLIPRFFYQAIDNIKQQNKLTENYPKVLEELGLEAETKNRPKLELNIQTLADEMDEIYMYGGFKFAFEGTIDEDGVYASPYEEDEDLYPYARFYHPDNSLELFVYKYGIIGIRDSKNTKNFKIARFD
jgi:hypothetical protein